MTEEDIITGLYEEDGQLTEKQKQILIAAIDIFARKGYSTASTSEIAKHAGVAEGTIFRHYKTKKELLLSIVSPVMSRMVAPFIIKDVKKVLHKDHETFEAFLWAMINNRILFIKKNLPILKIMLQEIPFHDDLRQQFLEHVGKEMILTFKQVIQHFQEKGEIRTDLDTDSLLRLVGFSIIGYLLPCLVLNPTANWDHEKEINLTIDYILRGARP